MFNGFGLCDILFAKNNAAAKRHIRQLSKISFLCSLYSTANNTEHEKRVVLLLLLHFALHGHAPDRKKQARTALLKLGIISNRELRPVVPKQNF
jgi:hypothetical protein